MIRDRFGGRFNLTRKARVHAASGITAVFILSVCFFVTAVSSAIEWNGWSEVSPVISGNITCAKNVQGLTEFYLGTEEGLYRTENAGGSWEKQVLPAGNFEIRDMFITDDAVIVAVKNGIFLKENNSAWKCLFGIKNISGITVEEEKGNRNVLAWRGRKLFRIEESAWKSIGPEFLRHDIADVFYRDGVLFAAAGRNLFVFSAENKTWEKFSLPGANSSEEEEVYEDDIDESDEFLEENQDSRAIRHLCLFENGTILAVTDEGMYTFDERNKVLKCYARDTLLPGNIRHVLHTGKYFFASDDNVVYRYIEKTRSWDIFFRKTPPGKISVLQAGLDEKGRAILWVAGGRDLHKMNLESFYEQEENFVSKKFCIFPEEKIPSMKSVHKMAIDYAEVSPEKIRAWRQRAKWKAILPKLSAGFSESIDENVEIYKSASTAYVVTGPEEKGANWDMDLSWDFSELIWNSSETSIDVRSKLMVQLRVEILEDITRLYFERKRIVSEVLNMRESSEGEDAASLKVIAEKMMRVEELTARIDALTGGKFSEAIERNE